jgi:hypothetical protein
MARIAAVTTGTAINSTTFGNALRTDYVSQTDTSTQALASDLNIANNALGRTVSAATLGLAATTFAAVGEAMVITGDGAANTVATITGGVTGQTLILTFVDALVTITDTDAHTANTVDLSAAFISADDTTLMLFFDGTSWYEISRSVN